MLMHTIITIPLSMHCWLQVTHTRTQVRLCKSQTPPFWALSPIIMSHTQGTPPSHGCCGLPSPHPGENCTVHCRVTDECPEWESGWQTARRDYQLCADVCAPASRPWFRHARTDDRACRFSVRVRTPAALITTRAEDLSICVVSRKI